MHLIRVDLPAPLSPTRAITSPSRTSKSTSLSAWTEPNDLESPRIWRSGVSLTVTEYELVVGGGVRRRLHLVLRTRLAVLRELADADVALLQELVLEEPRVVRLRDRDDRQRDGRLLLAAVLAEPVDTRDLLVLDEGYGRSRCRIRFGRHVLVDRHRLPARDDVLHARGRRVLPRARDRIQVLRLQDRHHGPGDVVVRRDRAVDLVPGLRQHLREDRACVRGKPVGNELLRALLQLAALEQRVQNGVVPALEPERVLVGR